MTELKRQYPGITSSPYAIFVKFATEVSRSEVENRHSRSINSTKLELATG
jgi:hypothetical protein